MHSGHAPTEMISDYAAGALPQGMSLLVASHLTYCPCCRDKVARLEALGGAFLVEGGAMKPTARCLKGALAQIDRPEAGTLPPDAQPAPLPKPLCGRLTAPMTELPWSSLQPGLSVLWLAGFPQERVGLLRAEPGTRVAAHGHSAIEATLVLAGRMHDRDRTFCRGEVAFADADVEHAPEAVGNETCLCLLVTSDDTAAQPALTPALPS